MNIKKSIAIIFILLFMTLPMMNMPVQAISNNYNLTSEMKGNTVYFSWNAIYNAAGYDLYINTANKGYEYIGSVNNNIAPVIGFKEGTVYRAKVCAYQMKNGMKEVISYSEEIWVNTTAQNILGKVTNLTASQNGGNVTLNWSSVSNVTGYQIFVNIPSFGYVNIGSVDGGSTSAIITGFENGKTYQFKVRAYQKSSTNTLNYGDFSPERTLTINKNIQNNNPAQEETKPTQVKNLTLNSIDKNTVNISWDKVNGAKGYEIWLAQGNENYKKIGTVYNNYTPIKGLQYNTSYKVKVRAFAQGNNGIMYGDESTYLSFTTPMQEITVGQVQNVTTTVKNNQVTINWSKTNNAQWYSVYLSKYNTNNFQYATTVYGTSTVLTNLDYNTNYYIKIYPYANVNGKVKEGTPSNIKRFTTQKQQTQLPTIQYLEAKVQNRNEAKLAWWSVEGAQGYEVWLSKNGGTYQKVQELTQNYTMLYSLDYNTNYYVAVRAYRYVNGEKQYSQDYKYTSFRTQTESILEGNQSVPRVSNVSANVVKDTVYLTWSPVKGAVKYEIEFYVPGVGNMYFTTYTNSRTVSGLTEKEYHYSARVRAYKWVNGQLVAGEYSYIQEFTGK